MTPKDSKEEPNGNKVNAATLKLLIGGLGSVFLLLLGFALTVITKNLDGIHHSIEKVREEQLIMKDSMSKDISKFCTQVAILEERQRYLEEKFYGVSKKQKDFYDKNTP